MKCNRTAEARVIFFGPEFIDRIAEIKAQLDETIETYVFIGPEAARPAWSVAWEKLIDGENATDPCIALDINDDAALYFTSGTTGTPKATLLTHRNLESACIVENQHHRLERNDNFLCIPPLYHTGAKMHWFGNFIVGARAVILKGIDPKWILEAVSEEKITVVWLLVPWALDILFAIESGDLKLDDYKLDQWRLMHIGAQPVPPSLIKEWHRFFPKHQYDTNYGLTEATGPGCVHLGMDNMHKVGAIGRPGFDWEVRIDGDDGRPVAQGEPGELAVRGPGVMKCYYRNEEASAKVLVDGWLLTGDVARQGRGGLHLVGGPQEGRHHHRRREHLPRGDRGLSPGAPRHRRRGGHRPAQPATGGDRHRHRQGETGP
jgi:fatty-acyl-CoA synthase